MPTIKKRTAEAGEIIERLGLPKKQQNARTARVLLALLNLSPEKAWNEATNPMLGIRAILDFIRENLDFIYAENSRESVRKYSVKQLVEAGIALQNPDDPERAVNSSQNCYQIDSHALRLARSYGSETWDFALQSYLANNESLATRYAKIREDTRIPLHIKDGVEMTLSPGAHSTLILQIINNFGGRYVPGGELVYVGDTGTKWGYFDEEILSELGVLVGNHGKMPDVVIYDRRRNWLVLAEATSSTGPVDAGRYAELTNLFSASTAGLVYVTAFPDRGKVFRQFLSEVAWETEVWVASDPTHIIHFNGVRFLGPYR